MGPLGILDGIAGITNLIMRRIGDRMRDWGRYLAEEPEAAALLLQSIAHELEARAKAKRRQQGWVARRHYARADALRAHAQDLIAYHERRESIRNPLRDPCE